MGEPGSEFEHKAFASEAAEAGRVPSLWHRRSVWALGLVSLVLWAALLYLTWRDGLGSSLVFPAFMAAINTALFMQFLMRIREADRAQAEGRPVRYRRG